MRSEIVSRRWSIEFEDRHAALVDAVDQRAAGIGDGHRQLGRRRQDEVADHVARRAELVAQGLVGARNRAPDPLGMADQRVALAAQAVDQAADAHLVLRIGAFQLVDLGVNQGLQLDSPGQGALDAFAHGGDLAAHRLTNGHHAILGERFGLGQAQRQLGHRLGGRPHLLGAADHDREAPEEQHRHHQGDGEQQEGGPREQRLAGADPPDLRAEEQLRQGQPACHPGERQQRDCPIDGIGRAPVDAAHRGAVVLLPVVIGGRQSRARLRGRPRRRLRLIDGAHPHRDAAGLGLRIGLERDARQLLGLALALPGRGGGGRGGLAGIGGLVALALGTAVAGAVAAFAGQLVGGLRNLRLEVLHRGGDVEIADRLGRQVEVERLLELLGHVGVEILRRGGLARHAAITLYMKAQPKTGGGSSSAARVACCRPARIVVTQPAKGNPD